MLIATAHRLGESNDSTAPVTRRRRNPTPPPRPQKGARVFWTGPGYLEGEQLIIRVRDGTESRYWERKPTPGPQTWKINITHHTDTHNDKENQTRCIRLSMAAFPIVHAPITETTSPAILADWIEDHPGMILEVGAKRSHWRKTEFRVGRGYGQPVEDEIEETDDEAVAGLLNSLRLNWVGSFTD